jgi:membrane protease YdiL (CAAX protease family)
VTSPSIRPAPPERQARPARTSAPALPSTTLLRVEVILVVTLAVGLSAARSVLNFIASATAGALSTQAAVLNGSYTPRQWLDLSLHAVWLVGLILPVCFAIYLLVRSGETVADIGIDDTRPRRDALNGALIAAVIGGTGLLLYLGAYAAGASLTVVPSTLPDVWWRIPFLLLSALGNALLEEVVLLGFLMRRGDQLGWSPRRSLLTSAGLRAAYHLYQGLGGLIGNFVMGLIFGRLYQRTGRLIPLIVAHFLIDAVAFVGYVLLAGHVDWLPVPR